MRVYGFEIVLNMNLVRMNLPAVVNSYLPLATPEKSAPVQRVSSFFDSFSRSREATATEIFELKLRELVDKPVGVLGFGEYYLEICTMLHDSNRNLF